VRPAVRVPVATIVVGRRRREDLGDLTGLMQSIREVGGLIHPIVVTDDRVLVAGERRLEATKRLGWEEIEVRWVGELSAHQRRMIELEENLHRQELSAAERTKTMAELVEVTAAHLREEAAKKTAGPTWKPPGTEDDHDPPHTNDTSR
jgi:ParB family transcriptional regulator, chromosome partitioning protein